MTPSHKDDEFLITDQKLAELSKDEILAIEEGITSASEIENGLKLNKGTLRKFAQAEAASGRDTYKEYGIGRTSFSNRYMVRLSVFTKMWDTIADRIRAMGLTQVRFKTPPKDCTIGELIEDGGIYKLSRLEGKMKFKVRALKYRYYELLKEGKDPREEFGIYKDGKLFLVDMKSFGQWYAAQDLR